MLLACGSLGAPPGMLLSPIWPLDWKPLGPSSWCGVRPHRWAALGAGLCFCSGAQDEGTLLSPGCPGNTPGCRQQCCARVPPCMSGSRGEESRQWVSPARTGSPGSDAMALPYLFPPLCSQLHPTLQAPSCGPGFPQTAAVHPHCWGITAGPRGQGCGCRQEPQLQAPQTTLCSCFASSRLGAGAGWSSRLAGSGCAD